MRRIMLLLAVAAVMAAMVIAPGVVGAQENVAQICKEFEDLGFGSHGGCTATFTTENHTPGRATACQDPDFVAFIEFSFGEIKNPGQCIKVLREFFG